MTEIFIGKSLGADCVLHFILLQFATLGQPPVNLSQPTDQTKKKGGGKKLILVVLCTVLAMTGAGHRLPSFYVLFFSTLSCDLPSLIDKTLGKKYLLLDLFSLVREGRATSLGSSLCLSTTTLMSSLSDLIWADEKRRSHPYCCSSTTIYEYYTAQ